MEIEFQLTRGPIAEKIPPPARLGMAGAWLEFRGVVRGGENGQAISALEYEAYPEMAEREIRRLLTEISTRHLCIAAKVIHRVGVIPVGDTAIYVGVASPHRREAIALLAEFMDQLKRDVPIWKRRAIAGEARLSQPLRVEIPIIEGLFPTDQHQGPEFQTWATHRSNGSDQNKMRMTVSLRDVFNAPVSCRHDHQPRPKPRVRFQLNVPTRIHNS